MIRRLFLSIGLMFLIGMVSATTYVNFAPSNLTSNTQYGYTLTGSGAFSDWPYYYAFDNNTATAWANNGGATQHINVSLPSPHVLINYTLWPRNDNANTPNTWGLYASNDGSTWVLLDSESGVTWPNINPKSYLVSNSVSYSYYSVATTVNNGGDGIGLAQIYLYESAPTAPTASFTSNHTSGVSPLAVQFNDTSTGSPTSWFWQFQDDITNPSTLQNPVHIFTNPGNWSVILNVTNAYGYNVSAPMWINVSQSAPITSFTGTPTTGATPLSVAFSDTSSGSPTSWNWSFGDGNYSASKNPSHVYSSIGSYTVSLNATNAIGSNISTVLNYITTHGASGFTRQDLVLSIQHTLTLTFVDSSTNQPIPVVRVVDANSGTSVNTTTGIYTGTFGYTTALLYLYSDGYQSKSVSYIMSSNRTEIVQLVATPSVSQATNVWWTPHQVRMRFLDCYGAPIVGATLNSTAIASSIPASWLTSLYGINATVAAQMITTNGSMSGTTASDGAVTITTLSSLEYTMNLSGGSLGTTNYSLTTYPLDSQYNIYACAGTGPIQGNNSASMVTSNNTLTFTEPNMSYMTMGLNYYDPTGNTQTIDFVVVETDNKTKMYEQIYSNVGTQQLVTTYTVPNIRGQHWRWYYNRTYIQ